MAPFLLSWLVWVAPAAAAPDPLPFTSLTPANGTSFPKGQTGYPFPIELKGDSELVYIRGEVSTSTLTGVDGSLADDFLVDTFYLFESDAFPGTFSGNGGYTAPSLGGWKQTPGTYYWQFGMRCYWNATSCGGSGVCCTDRTYLSPVRTITVTAPSTGTPPGGGAPPGGNAPPAEPPPIGYTARPALYPDHDSGQHQRTDPRALFELPKQRRPSLRKELLPRVADRAVRVPGQRSLLPLRREQHGVLGLQL